MSYKVYTGLRISTKNFDKASPKIEEILSNSLIRESIHKIEEIFIMTLNKSIMSEISLRFKNLSEKDKKIGVNFYQDKTNTKIIDTLRNNIHKMENYDEPVIKIKFYIIDDYYVGILVADRSIYRLSEDIYEELLKINNVEEFSYHKASDDLLLKIGKKESKLRKTYWDTYADFLIMDKPADYSYSVKLEKPQELLYSAGFTDDEIIHRIDENFIRNILQGIIEHSYFEVHPNASLSSLSGFYSEIHTIMDEYEDIVSELDKESTYGKLLNAINTILDFDYVQRISNH